MKKIAYLSVVLLCFFSCNVDIDDITEEEQRLLDIAYSDTIIWVDNFYVDSCEHSVYYVNTVSTTPPEENVGLLSWYDLATDDYQQALAWTDSSISFGTVDTPIYKLSERQTSKYFEFVISNGQYSVAYRVHKLSYFKSLIDRLNVTSDTMGIYHGTMTADKVKEFSDYMFYRNRFKSQDIPSGYDKILDSSIENYSNYFLCTIESMLTVGGDWGIPDQIYVHRNEIKVIKESGYVTYDREKTKQISGHQN